MGKILSIFFTIILAFCVFFSGSMILFYLTNPYLAGATFWIFFFALLFIIDIYLTYFWASHIRD